MTKRIIICMAQEEPGKIEPTRIEIEAQLPPWEKSETYEERKAFYEAQARKIQQALKVALPQATYDRVVALMLLDFAGVMKRAYAIQEVSRA